MTGFPINPPRAPITDDGQIVSSEWYRYFAQIHDAVGSSASATWEDGFLLASVTPDFPEVAELEASGSAVTVSVRTVDADWAALDNDCFIRGDATAADLVVLLPLSAHCPGRKYKIKKIDASGNKVTIATQGGEFIDGASFIDITVQYESYTIISNGAGWDII